MSELDQAKEQEAEVKLIVGDSIFRVKESLLLNSGSDYFKKLLSDDWPDKKGDFIVIGRTDTYFPAILRYMAGVKEDFFGWSWRQLEGLSEDAGFYLLPELEASINDLLATSRNSDQISIPEAERLEIFRTEESLMTVLRARGKPSFVFRSRYISKVFEQYDSVLETIDRAKYGAYILLDFGSDVDVIIASPWSKTLAIRIAFRNCSCQTKYKQLESGLRQRCSIKYDYGATYSTNRPAN